MKHVTKTAAAAALAAAALSLGLASPAQASLTKDGCTVDPQDPYFAGTYNSSNVPEVLYEYVVTCDPSSAASTVEIKMETWESDLNGRAGDVDADTVNNPDDEHNGNGTLSTTISKAGGTKTIKIKGLVSHTDDDGNDEMYGKSKFRVKSGNVTGAWTGFELTDAVRIWW